LQNQILLDRLEGMHIVAAESERKASVSVTESGETSEVQGESDLQNVIRYLRRSKETVSHLKVQWKAKPRSLWLFTKNQVLLKLD
jgi:hypothetical protein